MPAKMEGAEAMIAQLKTKARTFPDRIAAAIYQEAQIEMTESKRRVPVKTGVLRESGEVSEPVRSGGTVSVTLSYGGAASDYAIPVHENLEAIHPIGQAKFLESVLNESREHMAERIGRRVSFNEQSD